ncbi:MAG: hypothetical protein DRJ42_03550 [Deltaproteobacteria bacterium]|nr:MAG: hypothetical protein DRJ42_03550 [Deltaproteobacteria bacterium]
MKTDENLGRAESGATMVIGIFMAVLLVGVLYYLWGIGEAIVYRQVMQDAADSAAFGGAVINARGMNLIALLNVIIAAAAAVETIINAIVSGLILAAAIATIVCIVTYGSSGCDEAATHAEEAVDMEDVRSDVEDDMEDIIDLASTAATTIRYTYPALALVKAEEYASMYDPPVTEGFLLPIDGLPVEEDDSDWPCDEKVAPFASSQAPIGTLICCDIDIYLLIGAASSMGFAYLHADDWCEDEYFLRVVEDAKMGDDNFQVRAYMHGDYPFEAAQERVGIAAWGDTDGAASPGESLQEIANWSFAQGEFYFDDDMDEEEWLWHMMWRARLRRFRLPLSGSVPGGAGGLSEIIDVVIH